MPGTVAWTGGGNDGVWATAGNWAAGTGTAPPANGDTVTIGCTNQNIHGATVATTTLTLRITPGYGGIIGDDAPLIFSSGLTLLEYAGTGAAINIACTAGTTTAASFNHTGGVATISGGTWTTLTNSTGIMTIAAAAIVTTLQNVAGDVTVGYNATAITTLTNSGRVTCSRSITTTTLDRGTLIHLDNGTTTYTTAGTVVIGNGATYNKRSGGTDALVTLKPGSKFTIEGTSGGSGGTVTLTNATVWAGSTLIDVVPGVAVTYTNAKVYVGAIAVGLRP